MWGMIIRMIVIKIISNLYLSHCRNWFHVSIRVDAYPRRERFDLTLRDLITLISWIWSILIETDLRLRSSERKRFLVSQWIACSLLHIDVHYTYLAARSQKQKTAADDERANKLRRDHYSRGRIREDSQGEIFNVKREASCVSPGSITLRSPNLSLYGNVCMLIEGHQYDSRLVCGYQHFCYITFISPKLRWL